MMREELCELLGALPTAPVLELVASWEQRVDQMRTSLREGGLPRPAKIKAAQELAALEQAGDLIAQLRILAKAESFLVEIAVERGKAKPVKTVIDLFLGKLREIIPTVQNETEKLGLEKRVAEFMAWYAGTRGPWESAPDIVTEPVPQRVAAGAAATFVVVARGNPPPTYQWRKNGTVIPGATGGTLTLESVQAADAGTYDVEASNARGRVKSTAVSLEIAALPAPPKITIEPIAQTTVAGEEMTMKVVATGTPPLAYQWRKDGVVVEGATQAALSLIHVGANDGGNYTVIVSNAYGSVTSGSAVLKITASASATRKPMPGLILHLTPRLAEGTLRKAGAPVHLVAKPRFQLGRQRAKADFVTWFLPETKEAKVRTDTISRVHTTLFVKGTQICVQDGEILDDGKSKPSATGTMIDGQAITTAIPLNFTKERRIKIGQYGYELAALQLPAVSPEGPLAAKASSQSAPPTMVLPQRPFGCIRFLPMSCREVWASVVWVFSEAAIGSSPQSAVRIEGANLPAVAARFHHWQGGFWLEVPSGEKSVVTFDKRRLVAGDVLPLQASHELSLGEFNYELQIS